MRAVTGVWGAIIEAWAELRIHRTRVLLSLVGVAVAVTALTGVVALGQIATQAQVESMERSSGRPALLSLYAYDPVTGEMPNAQAMDEAVATAVERYGIGHSSRIVQADGRAQFATGVESVAVQAVDADYGTMHRVELREGDWFVERDNDRLAPAIIVNEAFWSRLGRPDLATHPTVELLLGSPVTAVVVGVTPSGAWDTYPSMLMLYSAWERLTPAETALLYPANHEFWVPPELAEELMPLLQQDLAGALGEGVQADVYRNDYAAYPGWEQSMVLLQWLVGGGAVLVLLLGALGLVNISLVTVRQRIREIGIRRSFGATAPRVFFAVMMESVVATVVAGAIGVLIAVLVVRSPWMQDLIGQGVSDVPPFPVGAAVLGIAASVAVGALAGLLPALVAVRVKVIDAIRF